MPHPRTLSLRGPRARGWSEPHTVPFGQPPSTTQGPTLGSPTRGAPDGGALCRAAQADHSPAPASQGRSKRPVLGVPPAPPGAIATGLSHAGSRSSQREPHTHRLEDDVQRETAPPRDPLAQSGWQQTRPPAPPTPAAGGGRPGWGPAPRLCRGKVPGAARPRHQLISFADGEPDPRLRPSAHRRGVPERPFCPWGWGGVRSSQLIRDTPPAASCSRPGPRLRLGTLGGLTAVPATATPVPSPDRGSSLAGCSPGCQISLDPGPRGHTAASSPCTRRARPPAGSRLGRGLWPGRWRPWAWRGHPAKPKVSVPPARGPCHTVLHS